MALTVELSPGRSGVRCRRSHRLRRRLPRSRLDARWQIGFSDEAWIVPGGPCEICGRRSAIHIYGGPSDGDVNAEPLVLDDREIRTCGWCQLYGQIMTSGDLVRAMAAARAESVAWRWRWRVRTDV